MGYGSFSNVIIQNGVGLILQCDILALQNAVIIYIIVLIISLENYIPAPSYRNAMIYSSSLDLSCTPKLIITANWQNDFLTIISKKNAHLS